MIAKYLTFLSPLASLVLSAISFVFIILLPPLWIPWLFLVIASFTFNYVGIRYVLGRTRARARWHHIFNLCQWAVLAILMIWLWQRASN